MTPSSWQGRRNSGVWQSKKRDLFRKKKNDFFPSFQPGHEVCWVSFFSFLNKNLGNRHTHTHTHKHVFHQYHTHTHTHFENSHRRHRETNAHRLFDYFKNKTRRRKRRSRRRYRPEWHPSMALKIFYPQVASQISVRGCWDYRPCCHSSAVEEPWRCCRSSSSWRFFGSFFLSFGNGWRVNFSNGFNSI